MLIEITAPYSSKGAPDEGDCIFHFLLLTAIQDIQFILLCFLLILLVSGSRLSKSQHAMKGGCLLRICITRGNTSIIQLLTSKAQPLMVRRSPFFTLDLGLSIVYSVKEFSLESEGIPNKGSLRKSSSSTADGRFKIK